MPKSKHRRKGGTRPRPGRGNTPPVFTYQGRTYRGVRRLPTEFHPDRLDDAHGDDAFTKCCELIRGALGDEAADEILADVTLHTPNGVDALLQQIARTYGLQIAIGAFARGTTNRYPRRTQEADDVA